MGAMNYSEHTLIDSDLLRTFLVIADQGNLTLAAGHLNRTQSAISVQLRKLEVGLGATLFSRTSRGMTLTPAGEKLLPSARSIVADIRQASTLFQHPLSGSIRLGLPDDFDESVLEKVLSGFSRAHPGVNVVATSGCTSGYPAAIQAGSMDIAVCSGPENALGETLDMEETVWAAKKGMRIEPDQPIPLAILDRSCWWQDLPSKSLDAIGRDYRVAFRSSSFASLQAAIRAGFAIGVLPGSCSGDGIVALTGAHGFPDLPKSRRSILIAPGAAADLTAAMAGAIRQARMDVQRGFAR